MSDDFGYLLFRSLPVVAIILIVWGFVSLVESALLEGKKAAIASAPHPKRRIDFNLTTLCLASTTVVNIALVMFVFSVFRDGVADYILAVRAGQAHLGTMVYFLLLSQPVNLLVVSTRKISRYFWVSTLIYLIANLLTGFRTILAQFILLMLVTHYQRIRNMGRTRIMVAMAAAAIVIIGYQYIRPTGHAPQLSQVLSLQDTLNRTAPVHQIILADKYISSPHLSYIIENFLTAPRLILRTFGLADWSRYGNYNIQHISERLFRNYLDWRGTPSYRATGFSQSFISYGYSVGWYLGLLFVTLLIYIQFLIGKIFFGRKGYAAKIVGIILVTFCWAYVESYPDMVVSLMFFLIYFLALRALSRLYCSIARTKGRNLRYS